MASKVGQSVSQSLGGLSLASGSMLLRLRRTSIALLALVGAVSLGLIVFISQLGWPAVLSGPLPGVSQKAGTVHEGVALTRPASVAAGVPAAGSGGASGARARQGKSQAGRRPAGESDLSGSRGLIAASDAQPGTGSGQPVSQPASQPAPVTSPPAATTPAAAGNQSSSAAGNAKAANDGARSDLAATKQQGPKTAGKDPSSAPGSKPAELASVKAQNDASTVAEAPAPTVPPAPAANPAAAKEAADAAR